MGGQRLDEFVKIPWFCVFTLSSENFWLSTFLIFDKTFYKDNAKCELCEITSHLTFVLLLLYKYAGSAEIIIIDKYNLIINLNYWEKMRSLTISWNVFVFKRQILISKKSQVVFPKIFLRVNLVFSLFDLTLKRQNCESVLIINRIYIT